MSQLNIKRIEWENLDDGGKSKFVQKIIRYYRDNGFPHFEYSIEEQKKALDVLDRFTLKSSIETVGILRQTMHGVGVCWSYHPHHWNIRCGSSNTPMEVFKSDKLIEKAIRKRMSSGTHINNAMMRKTFKVSGGAQTVSNFRPSVARWIYDKYGGDGVVYDPCAGFGGRLFGAISSPRVKSYEGCEPSHMSWVGLCEMSKNLSKKKIILREHGSENYTPEDMVDLIFTSPPYFNTEKYSEEETQSYIKFPTYDEWVVGFLNEMLCNSIKALKRGGYLIINIANVKSAPYLENDFKGIMEYGTDLDHITTYKMALSKQHSGGKFKYEPIFVYKKR